MLDNLMSPIKLGPIEVKNRVAMAPMNVHWADRGFVTEQDIAYYAARAKGGVGLIYSGCVITSKKAAEPLSLVIHHLFEWVHIAGFQEIAEVIHEFGGKFAIQLSPGFGRQTRHPRTEFVAPSAVPMQKYPELQLKAIRKVEDHYLPFVQGAEYEIPREMTIEEILEAERDLVKSAKMALYAGADAVELHAPHGYLIHNFLSPRTNLRNDLYGGSLENRMRFLIELVEKTKDTVKDQCALGVRISADEHVPGGMTLDDVKIITKACEKAGADYIQLSDGCIEAMKFFFPEEEREHLLDEANAIKKGLNIPVITPSIHDPEHGNKAIGEGKTDMISLGRQLIADPDWVNKAQEGRISEINRCRRDSACLLILFNEGRIRCAFNPNLGREKYMPEYWPQKKSGKLLPSLLLRKKTS